jgi:hypothetical protein
MRGFRTLACAALLAMALASHATPVGTNVSDLWWDPAESGWGLNLIHQGDTLFGTLFVYGTNGQPTWYSASDLRTSDGRVYSGALHESTGPTFGRTFNPANVSRRQVGTMTFELTAADAAQLRYSVDGTSVAKSVRRFVFRPVDLSGSYSGSLTHMPAINAPLSITVNSASGTGMTLATLDAAGESCVYSGSYATVGQLAQSSGTFSCTRGRSGNFAMADIDITRYGFTARFRDDRMGGSFGRMAGARSEIREIRGDGWRTDLWWAPGESGWGLNVIEQGDVLFATLFVYDANGVPRWYSASSLAWEGPLPGSDSSGRYSGALHESTGPFLGAAFHPGAVQRRQVGTMEFEAFGNRSARLRYVVDGMAVSKDLEKFAFRRNDAAGEYSGRQVEFEMVGATVHSRSTPLSITISESGGSFRMTTQPSSGPCNYEGARGDASQYGQLFMIVGTFACADGRSGSFLLENMDVSASGFTARLAVGSAWAHVSGARIVR